MLDILFASPPTGGLVEFGPLDNPQYYPVQDFLDSIKQESWPATPEQFFAPALRLKPGASKEDVLGSRVLWADVDKLDQPKPVFPATFEVFSGHGWHYYWVLDDWITSVEDLETYNKLVGAEVEADHCWNANRKLRAPGTWNLKSTEPVMCRVVTIRPQTYTLTEIALLQKIRKTTKHKIRTADRRGYTSRSERDFAVVKELVLAGVEDGLIEYIFTQHKIGDKMDEQGDKYFQRTLESAHQSVDALVNKLGAKIAPAAQPSEFEETEMGYFAVQGKTRRQLSTFTLHPVKLLEGDQQDALVCNVKALNYEWPNITFTREAFSSRRDLDKQTRLASWQWLGRDDDIRALLPYLLQQLERDGLPKIRATSILGVHRHLGRHWAVGVGTSISATTSGGDSVPMVHLGKQAERPQFLPSVLTGTPDRDKLARIGALLPDLNTPGTIYASLGWFCACPFKWTLAQAGLRFPTLCVFGTRGSGKSTTILRVLNPLVGIEHAKSYDVNTTPFVTLTLMGTSNALPVAFSEYRQAHQGSEKFLRYLLLAYDTGSSPRGRADQTTQDYPLIAPFTVDGEDKIGDSAAQERIVAVEYLPDTVKEGTSAHAALAEFMTLQDQFSYWALEYWQYCLRLMDSDKAIEVYRTAFLNVHAAFPQNLPDRVRHNITVAYMGLLAFAGYTQTIVPDASIMEHALKNVYSPQMGRSQMLCDTFTVDLINYITTKPQAGLPYEMQGEVMWFQLAPALSWWTGSRRRQNASSLSREAIISQLSQTTYALKPKDRNGRWMYGINLLKAFEGGLDVPKHFSPTTFTVKF